MGRTRGHVHLPPSEVTAFVLEHGRLRAELWDLGATLVVMEVPDRDGMPADVVRRHADLAGYDDPDDRAGYLGATIGRYANRIAGGRCPVEDTVLSLARNDGPNHLHGGRIGFDQHVWTAEIDTEATAVTFTHVSPDGDEGYPGRLEARVTYRLTDSALKIAYEATTDGTTLVNLTNHAYWNLAGGGPVTDHELTVAADHYLPVDGAGIPTGAPAPVAGTRFDFRERRPIGPPDDGGFDHCYLLDGGVDGRPAAELVDPRSGRRLRLHTDQPGVQVYTAAHLDPPHTAVCLETQVPPDTPNRPALGSAVLRPGETYRHRTVHAFDVAPGRVSPAAPG